MFSRETESAGCVCVCVCVCVCIHTYIHIYIYIYIWKEVYCKELAYKILELWKLVSPNLEWGWLARDPWVNGTVLMWRQSAGEFPFAQGSPIFLFYPGLQLIGWGPSTLLRQLCHIFAMSLACFCQLNDGHLSLDACSVSCSLKELNFYPS